MPPGRGSSGATNYAVLLRGINVGGKNKLPMAGLKKCMEELGFSNVSTLIASGNVILESSKQADAVRATIEDALPRRFKLDSEIVRVLVLSREDLRRVVDRRPKGFGDHPETYHSDVIFLMGIDPAEAMKAFDPREGVDRVWPGKFVIYSRRLSAERTKSRLNKVMGSPAYKSMTIRNWSTTTRLLEKMGAQPSVDRKAKRHVHLPP